MNRKEAQGKWCPFARTTTLYHQGYAPATLNRDEGTGAPASGCHCIADGCAAWRWLDPASVPPISRHYRLIPGGGAFGMTHKEAGLVQRPADVPASWEILLEEGYFEWREDDAAYATRKAEITTNWPDLRVGYCGLVPVGPGRGD